jgi:hypothetical protein
VVLISNIITNNATSYPLKAKKEKRKKKERVLVAFSCSGEEVFGCWSCIVRVYDLRVVQYSYAFVMIINNKKGDLVSYFFRSVHVFHVRTDTQIFTWIEATNFYGYR